MVLCSVDVLTGRFLAWEAPLVRSAPTCIWLNAEQFSTKKTLTNEYLTLKKMFCFTLTWTVANCHIILHQSSVAIDQQAPYNTHTALCTSSFPIQRTLAIVSIHHPSLFVQTFHLPQKFPVNRATQKRTPLHILVELVHSTPGPPFSVQISCPLS